GNVLYLGGMGKLADLGYAEHMNSNVTHEVRTDTLEFMACEVESQNYLFQMPTDELFDPVEYSFKFNPLHDMESLWWIATWTLYYHVNQKGGRPSSGQITQFHELFPGRFQSALRRDAFRTALKYTVLPASFNRAGREVEYMRQRIQRAYAASEEKLPPDYENPLEHLHSLFAEHLASAFADSKNIEIFSPNAK
ncbi:hypothetical protein EDD15DRAFT_2166882, partial [Pisolithus albus]